MHLARFQQLSWLCGLTPYSCCLTSKGLLAQKTCYSSDCEYSCWCCRRDGKQIKDDYDNLKAETKVLNEIIERLQGVEGSNSQLLSEADQLRYMCMPRDYSFWGLL